MPFFDFHLHPTLKSLFSDSDPAAGLVKLSPWVPLEKNKIPFLLKCCTDFQYILQSQGNLTQLADSQCNLICVALYMPEKDILTASLILDATKGSLKAYLQPKKVEKLTTGNPYQILLQDDWYTLTGSIPPDGSGRKVKPLKSRGDYEQADLSTIHAVFSVEGCHTLSSQLQHFDPVEIMANLDDLRSRVSVLSVNLTHMEQSALCNQAYGMQFLDNDGFKPTGNKISADGITIIGHCYTHRIMIDIKHMSLGARIQLYQLRNTPEFIGINQPIVCTHAGFTGISVNEIPDYIFQLRSFKKGYTVLWQGKPVLYRKGGDSAPPSFNASSINLYDEDILQILKSGGMIGLSLDKRILGYQDYEEAASERDDYPMETEYISNDETSFFVGNTGTVKVGAAFEDDRVQNWGAIEAGGTVNPQVGAYHLLHFMAHILHVLYLSHKHGYDPAKALTQICIGSDFDGLINPVWSCGTATDLAAFKQQFEKGFVSFAKDSDIALPPDFDTAVFSERLFFENGRDFVLGRLDALTG